jgi:PKD repeat protein
VIASNVWNYGAEGQPVGENGYPQVAVDTRDVKPNLQATGNVFGIQSTAWAAQPCMAAIQQLLVVEYYDAPVAGFAASTTIPAVGQTVTFTDQSTKSPTSWAWDFDNNGVVDSTLQNPTHSYSAIGTYTVKLTATNPGGSDTELKTGYITVSAAPALLPLPGYTNPPTDPDHDGLYEDMNANGSKDLNDVVQFFKNINWIVANEPVAPFDFNGNGSIDLNDIVRLFKEMV